MLLKRGLKISLMVAAVSMGATTMADNAVMSMLSSLHSSNAPAIQTLANPTGHAPASQQNKPAIVSAKKVILAHIGDFLHDPKTPVVNAKGTVTLVEFFDYQCSICHMMYSIINSVVAMDPHLRIVYKDFPIFGPASTYAAKGSIAAYQQGPKLYQAYHDAVFNIGAMEGSMTIPEVDLAAQGAGLNMKAFHAAVNSKAVADALKQSIALGKSINMMGTPALIIAPTDATANTTMQQLTYYPGFAQKPQLLTAIAHAQ